MEYLLEEIKNDTGVDLSGNERAKARLRKAAKEAKHELTAAEESEVNIEGIASDADFEHTVTRERFNEICLPIFNRCIECVNKGLQDANLSAEEIDEVILVGGSTRIIKVQDMLTEHFSFVARGKQLNKMMNPDEAVAIGATIQAGIISGSESVADIDYQDALALPIGLRINNPKQPGR